MRVRLTITKPGGEEKDVTFDTPVEVTLGRSPNCTICLDSDPMVSRMHAVVMISPPHVRVKDLNSTNGIAINGEPYGGTRGEKVAHAIVVGNGDELGVGSTRIVFKMEGEGGEAAAGGQGKTRVGEPTPINMFDGERTNDEALATLDGGLVKLATLLPEVPGFTVKKLLGPRKRGALYQAVSTVGEKVVIEMLLANSAFTKNMLDHFILDVEALKQLNHPQLIKILDCGAIGNSSIYLVMDFVNGEDLSSYLKRCTDHRINLRASCSVILHIVSALCYAHGRNVVHGELTPRNVVLYDLSGMLHAKVTNIGLAGCLEDSGVCGGFTVDATSREELAYLAPEQLTEPRELRPTADVFSVAAILYEMLTGSVPYNFGDNPGDFARVVADADMTPIENRISTLPASLMVIIDRCLAPDPDLRYPNCGELLEALEDVVM